MTQMKSRTTTYFCLDHPVIMLQLPSCQAQIPHRPLRPRHIVSVWASRTIMGHPTGWERMCRLHTIWYDMICVNMYVNMCDIYIYIWFLHAHTHIYIHMYKMWVCACFCPMFPKPLFLEAWECSPIEDVGKMKVFSGYSIQECSAFPF